MADAELVRVRFDISELTDDLRGVGDVSIFPYFVIERSFVFTIGSSFEDRLWDTHDRNELTGFFIENPPLPLPLPPPLLPPAAEPFELLVECFWLDECLSWFLSGFIWTCSRSVCWSPVEDEIGFCFDFEWEDSCDVLFGVLNNT